MTSTTLDKLCKDVAELKLSFEEFCRQTKQIIGGIDEQLANASNDQKEWKDIRQKLQTSSIKGKVKLDVGGEIFSASVETLTREKNTFFTALFSKQWELECDPDDKSIFIDRNGKLFTYILDYLRNGELSYGVNNDEALRRNLITEAKYFHLHNLLYILMEPERKVEAERVAIENAFPESTLLKFEHKRKLNEFYGLRDQQWELIYKASRDGFGGNTFHSHCNEKGPTMTIILSNNNYLFGGYTSVPWTSSGSKKNDTTAFLFTLTNPYSISPTKYPVDPTKASSAVYHDGGHGPKFGSESQYDLRVDNASNSNNNASYTNFPSSYIDTTGKGNNTFTGARSFTTTDIEVFKLA